MKIIKDGKENSQSWNKLYNVNTNAFTIDNFSEQTLVQPKTRVGLVAVSNTVPRIFIMAGETFRIYAGTRDIWGIDITVTTELVVINIEEKSILNTVVEDLALSITEGIKVNVLAEI